MTTSTQPQAGLPTAATTGLNKTSLVIGALGLVAIGALAAVLLLGNRTPVAEPGPVAAQASAAAAVAEAPSAASASAVTDGSAAPVTAAATPQAPPAPVMTAAAPKPQSPKAADPSPAIQSPAAEPAPTVRTEVAAVAPAPMPKPVCATCGVVTSVTPVQQKGEAGALGTVAGGVVGGVLGHQMGGGTGKQAMTVIGAVGGAVAGREIEKRQRSTTVYDIRIRMDDGSTRSFTRDTTYAVGQKVRVVGDELSLDAAAVKKTP